MSCSISAERPHRLAQRGYLKLIYTTGQPDRTRRFMRIPGTGEQHECKGGFGGGNLCLFRVLGGRNL